MDDSDDKEIQIGNCLKNYEIEDKNYSKSQEFGYNNDTPLIPIDFNYSKALDSNKNISNSNIYSNEKEENEIFYSIVEIALDKLDKNDMIKGMNLITTDTGFTKYDMNINVR